VPATFINGDLGPREKKIRYQLLRDHAVKFLYCTPERFDPSMVRPAEVGEINQTRPQYLVVDEAHCIDCRFSEPFPTGFSKSFPSGCGGVSGAKWCLRPPYVEGGTWA
jgi:hypothetical protein